MPVPVLAARWDQMERDPRANTSIGRGRALCAWWSVASDESGRLTGCRTELTRSFRFDEAGGWGFRPGQ